MRIAILSICTGKYTLFFDGLYNSIKSNFVPEISKTFFVFTDGNLNPADDIEIIYQVKLGWPYDTMMRFKMFNRIASRLSEFDYVFFFNANMLVVEKVTVDVLPIDEDFVGVIHPGYYNKTNFEFPYERRILSEFYIQPGSGQSYYQGCLNGGKANNFLEMSKILETKIDIDLNNNIIPIWHDESALNWFFKDNKIHSLSPSYAYPESSIMPFQKKIVQLDKYKYGGHMYLRN